MANGTFQISKGSYGLDVTWESQADATKNTSTVTAEVSIRYYSVSIGQRQCRCTVDGQTQQIPVSAIHHSGSAQRKTVGSFTFTVPHEADGTKTCALSAGFYFDLTSGNYGYIGWLEAGGDITLDPIPRAAQLTATGGVIGGEATFAWTPNADAHRFSLAVTLGAHSLTPTVSGSTARVALTEEILDALSGTPPTATGTAKLTTYEGDTVLGVDTADFSVTLPTYLLPSLTVLTCCRADQAGNPDTGGNFLQLDIRVTGSSYPKDSTEKNVLRLWLDGGHGKVALPLTDGGFSGIAPGITLDTAQVYHLRFWAEDLCDSSATVLRDIPTAAADFHLRQGGKGAAFGCYATRENALQLAQGWTLYIGDLPLDDYIRQLMQTG